MGPIDAAAARRSVAVRSTIIAAVTLRAALAVQFVRDGIAQNGLLGT